MSEVNISNGFKNILLNYNDTVNLEKNTKKSSIYPKFVNLFEAIAFSESIKQNNDLLVKWSCGKGAWASIPWLAIFHTSITSSTQKGVYCIYLFREDMKGFYLTLNQGVTSGMNSIRPGENKYSKLHSKAQEVRVICSDLKEYGFLFDYSIDLKSSSALGKSYIQSTIAHKYYDATSIPTDKVLLDDLDILLKFYLKYVNQ